MIIAESGTAPSKGKTIPPNKKICQIEFGSVLNAKHDVCGYKQCNPKYTVGVNCYGTYFDGCGQFNH